MANALEMGATLETGGGEVPAQGGNFFTPTVLSGVTNDMAPFREETFGPVCPGHCNFTRQNSNFSSIAL